MKLYAISIDPLDVSKRFAEKIAADGKGKVDFPLLSDPGHKVIDTYSLLDPAYQGQDVYGIPHPAVYVIDKSGYVSWVKIESNYRERPVNEPLSRSHRSRAFPVAKANQPFPGMVGR